MDKLLSKIYEFLKDIEETNKHDSIEFKELGNKKQVRFGDSSFIRYVTVEYRQGERNLIVIGLQNDSGLAFLEGYNGNMENIRFKDRPYSKEHNTPIEPIIIKLINFIICKVNIIHTNKEQMNINKIIEDEIDKLLGDKND